MVIDGHILLACIIYTGFTIANLIILGLNLKLYTEYKKDKLQDKRAKVKK
jgi:hypothetical protein